MMTGGMPGLTWHLVEISCSADRHDSGNVRVVQYLLVFDRRSLSDYLASDIGKFELG